MPPQPTCSEANLQEHGDWREQPIEQLVRIPRRYATDAHETYRAKMNSRRFEAPPTAAPAAEPGPPTGAPAAARVPTPPVPIPPVPTPPAPPTGAAPVVAPYDGAATPVVVPAVARLDMGLMVAMFSGYE